MTEYFYILPNSPFIIIHALDLSVYKLLYTESGNKVTIRTYFLRSMFTYKNLKSGKIHTWESINWNKSISDFTA